MMIKRTCTIALSLLTLTIGTFAATPADDILATTERFMQSLSADQKNQVMYAEDSDHRTAWNFLPGRSIKPNGRLGLTIKEMGKDQRLLTHAMVNAAMSSKGYIQATTVMMLEQILFDLEGQNAIRDPEMYHLSIFGTPAKTGVWGWRFEGHHMSINITIKDGKQYSVTPSFFGSNPGEVREGVFTGLRVLAEEEEIGRTLVKSLNAEQQAKAIIEKKAPKDILSRLDQKVDTSKFTPLRGINHDDLTKDQQATLLHLIELYVEKYRPEMVAEIMNRRSIDTANITFAWAGGLERGEPHYYRVQTEKFLFEYDNVQGGANHVHSVWRDFEGDFGADLLKAHYKKEHQ